MSIKTKVVLWYAVFMLAILIAVLGFIFYAGTNISKESGRTALTEVVDEAVAEILEEVHENKKPDHKRDRENERFSMDGTEAETQTDTETENSTEIKSETKPEMKPAADDAVLPYQTQMSGMLPYSANEYFKRVDTYDDGVYISIYDEEENLVYGLSPITLQTENAPRFANAEIQEYTCADEKWVFYDQVVAVEGMGSYTVRGITSDSEITDRIKTLLIVAVAAVPFIIALSVFGGYIITKRAFMPIKKITDTAEQISNGSDLSQRIDLDGGKDEIHALANTFDSMFDRLQEAFENEKQFTSDASHELRTPVSVIISQCEYSMENSQTLDEAKQGLGVVLNKAEKMSALLNQLLLLARADKGHQKIDKESFDISELAAMVVAEKSLDADKKEISIQLKTEESIVINADETLIMRMLINLIDNAIVYGNVGGKIEIGITKNDEDMVIGYVSDDGVGISKEDLPHIFERFYRVDKSRTQGAEGSSGLGLSMVKWIVNAHGGEITVKSELGKGTTFMFMIPCKDGE